jgi:hypothetical protein
MIQLPPKETMRLRDTMKRQDTVQSGKPDGKESTKKTNE